MVATSRFSPGFFRFSLLAFAWLNFARQPVAQAIEAYQPPPLSWHQDSWGASVDGEYFTTKANYDQVRGSYTRLLGNNNLSNFASHFRGRYGFSQNFASFVGLGLAQTQVTDATGNRSNMSVTDLSVGLDYVVWRRWVKLIGEGQAAYPIDAVDKTQTTPLTSNGVPFGRLGVFALKPFKRFQFSGYLGFDYPTVDLASKFLYQAYLEVPVAKFVFGGGIDGYEAVGSDSSNFADRQSTAVRADASSQRFYAFEPAFAEARVWVGVRPDKNFTARIGYAKSINGLRTAEGQSILFSLVFHAQDLFGPSVDTLEEEAKTGTTGNEGEFRSDMEKTDKSLFEDETRRPKRAAPRKSSQPDSLDQTEKILEKKAK